MPDRRPMVYVWIAIAFVLAALTIVTLSLKRRSEPTITRKAQPEMEVIDEKDAPVTGTIGEISGFAVPPVTVPAPAVPPAIVPQPIIPPPIVPPAVVPPPTTSTTNEITESDAMSTLRSYITSRRDYGVSTGCLVISSQGYLNAGYTMTAFDSCSSESMGQWRVDSKTREVYRRQSDGRYLRP